MLNEDTLNAIIAALEIRERALSDTGNQTNLTKIGLYHTQNALKQIRAIKTGQEVAIWWSVDDVKSFCEDYEGNTTVKITEAEALNVLNNFKDNHDGSMESMWQDLRYHFDNMLEERGEDPNGGDGQDD